MTMATSEAANSQWTAKRVRDTFIDYFTKQNGHTFVPSSSVIPYEDNTLLFVNSGMVQVRMEIDDNEACR